MTVLDNNLGSISRSDLISLTGIAISAMIAILLYVLGKKISETQRIDHITSLQNEIDDLLISAGARGTELYNSKLYTSTNFAKNKRSRVWGYAYQGAELRGYDFEGVEFIVDLVSWNETKYYKTGIISYEQILKIRSSGDGSTSKPIFFVKPRLFQIDKYSIAYGKFVYYEVDSGLSSRPPISYRLSTFGKQIFLKLRYELYYRWRTT